MRLIFIGFFATIACSLPQSVWAACGEILVSKGDIKIERGGVEKNGKATPGPQGTKVCQGDTIVAGLQSRAKVKMEDGNELNISPESRIKLETYEYKPADNKKKVMLNVLYGKVRAATREENMYNDKAKDGQANTFQVKTKSAVAGVRGTDFLTSFDRQTSKTEVITFHGKVEVGTLGAGGKILNSVSVGAGQKTEAVPGSGPAAPKMVPATEMESVGKETNASTSTGSSGSTASNGSGSSSSSGSSTGSSSGRTPAATTPSGSMVDSRDLASAPVESPGAVAKVPVTVVPAVIAPVTTTPTTTVPTCDLCNRAVESGPAKVRVNIDVKQ